MKVPSLDDYISLSEAAKLFGHHKNFWARLCQQGKLPGARKMGRMWVVPRESAQNYTPGPQGFAAVKKRAEEAAVLAPVAPVPLQGTEKQVAWADKIRTAFFALPEGLMKDAGPRVERIIRNRLATEPSAKWWIDNRDNALLNPLWLMGRACVMLEPFFHVSVLQNRTQPSDEERWGELRKHIDKLSDDELFRLFFHAGNGDMLEDCPPILDREIREAAEDEARRTIRPEHPVSELVVRIMDSGLSDQERGVISIRTRQRDENVSQTLRRLGFGWDNGAWKIGYGARDSGVENRIVEAAVNLVGYGFIVTVPRPELVERVMNAEYEPLQTKRIKALKDGSGFVVSWFFSDGDFYEELRKIPGAQWDHEKKRMVVPSEMYRDVLDFVDEHGFQMSDGAKTLAEEAERIRREALVSDVKPRKPKTRAKPKVGEIDESLRDDD